jgi:hypothetical protein
MFGSRFKALLQNRAIKKAAQIWRLIRLRRISVVRAYLSLLPALLAIIHLQLYLAAGEHSAQVMGEAFQTPLYRQD